MQQNTIMMSEERHWQPRDTEDLKAYLEGDWDIDVFVSKDGLWWGNINYSNDCYILEVGGFATRGEAQRAVIGTMRDRMRGWETTLGELEREVDR